MNKIALLKGGLNSQNGWQKITKKIVVLTLKELRCLVDFSPYVCDSGNHCSKKEYADIVPILQGHIIPVKVIIF